MRTLGRLQSEFQKFLLEGAGDIIANVAGEDDDFRRARLNIYFKAYRLRLVAALANDFPALKGWIGDERFETLSHEYIEARPSVFRNLRWFGHALPGFLRERPGYETEPVLAELAEFEWAQGLAFDAPDAPHLDVKGLADVPLHGWGKLRFLAHPSLFLVPATTNIVDIWNNYQAKAEKPPLASSEVTQWIAVWRRDYKTWFRTMGTSETMFWETISGGASFADACMRLARTGERAEHEASELAASLLAGWLQEGWIQSFE